MTNEQKLEQIKKMKIVPVVVLNTLEETLPKMQALIDGGLPCAEITFRTVFPRRLPTVAPSTVCSISPAL